MDVEFNGLELPNHTHRISSTGGISVGTIKGGNGMERNLNHLIDEVSTLHGAIASKVTENIGEDSDNEASFEALLKGLSISKSLNKTLLEVANHSKRLELDELPIFSMSLTNVLNDIEFISSKKIVLINNHLGDFLKVAEDILDELERSVSLLLNILQQNT